MSRTVEKTSNRVFVKDGRVVKSENWVLWNGTDWPTIVIQRNGNEFQSDIGDPEHGGGQAKGSLEKVLVGLHPKIQGQYQRLFALENPTRQAIEEVGFRGYLLVEQVGRA